MTAVATSTALWLLVIAALSYYLDGWLARRSNTASRWGALLDPITDRIFVFTAVSVFLVERQLTTLQYFILIFRDLMTGKLVTVFQLLTLVAVLARPEWVTTLVAIVGVLAVIAVIDYTLLLWRERVRTAA